MKYSLLLVIAIVFSPISEAQNIFHLDPQRAVYIDQAMIECYYNYTTVMPVNPQAALPDGVSKTDKVIEKYRTLLQTNAHVSKFWDINSFKKDSVIYRTKKDTILNYPQLNRRYHLHVPYLFTPTILKNYPQGKITVTDHLLLNECIYEINKQNYDWTITNDTLTVCGYLCKRATVQLGGRMWIAWYTSEISISDGPWKLYGLPGLILKAYDEEEIHTFEAVKIQQTDCPIYMEKSNLRVKTNRDNFIKQKNKIDSANNQLDIVFGVQSTRGWMSLSLPSHNEVLIVDDKRIWRNRISLYQPLELE